ncbi:MAG: ribokinase [Phenylobacterium sp.]|nr:ribokinase [Phenylobacterium sp.]
MAVCVLGGVNLDHVVRVEALPRRGETVAGLGLAESPGGKGANQAVAAALAGARTHLLGAVGADAAGARLRDFLRAAGVDVSWLREFADHPTGQAFISVDSQGGNTIVVASGANMAFLGEHVEAAPPPAARVFLTQFEASLSAIEALFRSAPAQAGIKILNAAPALVEGARLLALADVVVVNEGELATLAGLPAEPSGAEEAVAAARALARPGQTVLTTLGADGAVAVRYDQVIRTPGRKAAALDTTGAGDCFCGNLAAALSEGASLEIAMRFANAAASISVTRSGAAESMPAQAETQAVAGG